LIEKIKYQSIIFRYALFFSIFLPLSTHSECILTYEDQELPTSDRPAAPPSG